MPKFHVLAMNCERYEIEADTEEAAVKIIRDAHYAGTREQLDPVDIFWKFEGEGEVELEDE
jgi:hypothetical protein